MAAIRELFLITFVTLMCFAKLGSAIRCYECNSHTDVRCAQDIPPDELSIECGDHKHGVAYTFCRKITQVIEFSVNNLPPDSRVIRGCGWDSSSYKDKCYQRSGFGGRLEVCACSSDNCNGSVSMRNISAAFGLVMVALASLFSRW
ncbi:uncharacterized protein LOC132261423 [Phlebotomus argentipes]|uniref:uncharacterized protein LOC132261423 n=1 Tax=Phlebotomus argentipes TaxID=94469 RepID=UPI0028931F17|nr:uncharacterized protein LOC132261423 [Phlebotomus argentipes]